MVDGIFKIYLKIGQGVFKEANRCKKAYDPRIFVALGMCEDRLVVITTWRGEK